MFRWRIYYGDGTTFSDAEGAPEDAPAWNVQAIIQTDRDHGRNIQTARDYYICRYERWLGCDLIGVLDHLIMMDYLDQDEVAIDTGQLLLHATQDGLVKAGRHIPYDEFVKIWRVANSDPDFPHRTAYGVEEWKP